MKLHSSSLQSSAFRHLLDLRNFELLCLFVTGNGECSGSSCICNDGFTGGACECPTDNSTCVRPETGLLCSGLGQCVCGLCLCDDYAENFGEFCEECLVSGRESPVMCGTLDSHSA